MLIERFVLAETSMRRMIILLRRQHEESYLKIQETKTVEKIASGTISNVKRTALIAVLAALCIGTNYAMLPFPNVKLMDVIVFSTSLFFGFGIGVAVSTIAWLVYGTLNPLGLALPVLLAVIVCEMVYAVAGSLLRGALKRKKNYLATGLERSIVCGAMGLLSTLVYDVTTNAVFGLLNYGSIWVGLLTMNVPFPFGIIHEASNFVLFLTMTPILLRLFARGVFPGIMEKGKLETHTHSRNTWFTISLVLTSALVLTSGLTINYYGQYVDAEKNYLNTLSSLNDVSCKVNILIDYRNGTREWYNQTIIPVGTSVFNATSKAVGGKIEGQQYSFGVFVTSLNGVRAIGSNSWLWFNWDSAQNRWTLGASGPESYILKQGDAVGWLLTDDWAATP